MPSTQRVRRWGRFWWLPGLVALLFGGFLEYRSWQTATAHNWVPVRVPLRLDRRHSVTERFITDGNIRYSVLVELERNLPFEELMTIAEKLGKKTRARGGGRELPEIKCSLQSAGREALLEDSSGSMWGEHVSCFVGEFDAARGREFTLRAEVVRPAPALQLLNPHLVVEVNHHYSNGYVVGSGLEDGLAFSFVVIGLGLLVVGATWTRR